MTENMNNPIPDFSDEAEFPYNTIPLHLENERLKKQNEELEKKSNIDKLTDLYSRNFTEEILTNKLSPEIIRDDLTIALIDIDGFKIINDTLGHTSGDIILKLAGKSLKGAFRKDEIIGRWGGDEFLVILPALDEDRKSTVVDRIKKAGEENKFRFSVSTATIKKGEKTKSVEDFVKEADDELYKDKRIDYREKT